MKKYILLFACFLLTSTYLRVYADDNPFKMVYPTLADTVINVYLNKTDTIDISNITNTINGFSIDCKINQLSKNSFVRILLEDSLGHNYLVLENNRLRNCNDTVIFVQHCEETALLNNVKPRMLKFYIKDATIFLEKIRFTKISSNSNLEYGTEVVSADSIKKWQAIKIVNEINKYNRENNKLWVAGITSVSLMDYDAKKRVLGMSDDECDTKGIEYYVDGIFEIGESDSIDNIINDSIDGNNPIENNTNDSIESSYYYFAKSFDWRNRHGKNWMTNCKHQGHSGYCVAFAINGALEALVNLYYNKKIDLDLSEQDIVYTYARNNNYDSVSHFYNNGFNTRYVLNNIKSYGVIDEESAPFIDDSTVLVPSIRGESNECLFFKNFYGIDDHKNKIGTIKDCIISHGPLISGFRYGDIGHAMVLVGYNTIKEGDTINNVTTSNNEAIVIKEDDLRIGKTYWIFKNSYGDGIDRNGYFYILFSGDAFMNTPYYILTPITSKIYSDEDGVCCDNDSDGYYLWGMRDRPSNLPTWVPRVQDGDDSNAKYGPMDNYGRLMDLNPDNRDTIFINETTNWDNDNFIWQHVVVKNDGVLNITSNIKCYKGVEIVVKDGGRLIIDAGMLENVNLKILSDGELYVNNGGIIKKNKKFYTATNAKVLINNGVIK